MKLFILLILGIWIGMVLGISFVEAPLKFKAPNITMILGLGIGQLVFSALNKFEIVFSIFAIIWLIIEYKNLNTLTVVVLSIPILFIVLQSLWLFPILNARIDRLMIGEEVAKSYHHFYYIILEVLKVVFLIYSFLNVYHYE